MLALVVANIAFFALTPVDEKKSQAANTANDIVEESFAHWVAFMPDLEDAQRADPQTFGVHSDPPPVDFVEVVDGQPSAKLSMIAGRCGIGQYAIRNTNDFVHYMPERLFAGHLSEKQRDCLKLQLPDGYKLAQLAEPTKPSLIAWSADLSKLSVYESANAQTH
ncbi:hypothetical protein [Altererythrobacter sp. ZODW24]|uniref:hypothetical protein n=1 Tax=Altererythrobacter sp. ZODW24 TaxID=2185142 RepID=UPI0013B3C11B|nr:hypothetical protein [Altererythrobacter sp. ZODW24]